jgi:hypothetical protein
MILTLDNLGERYGRLPSEVLAQGSTLDLYIMDAALTYRDYQQKKADGKYTDVHTTNELQAILDKARNG